MAKLTEEMVHARSRQSNLSAVLKLNCWGTELQDVSLVRRLPNVETLSLSVNRIRSLADFQHCKKLQHLFVRKNDIRDLNQVCYLRDLPALKNLWLAENPCASNPGYRLTVIKVLPNLEKLDDIPVTAVERSDAQRHGGFLPHPEEEDTYLQSSENDEDPLVLEYPDEESNVTRIMCKETDDQFVSRANYNVQDYSRQYQRNEYSPELTSPVHSSNVTSTGNNFLQEEAVQNNGYDASTYEDDYKAHSGYVPTPPLAHYHKDVVDEEPLPRCIKQEEDHEDLQFRTPLTRSRTESLPRLSRIEIEEPEDYHRSSVQGRCRLETMTRSSRQDLEDSDSSQPRSSLTRSRTLEMLSLQERERLRHKTCEVYVPRSLQQPTQRPRNINVLNAVLCLIKELELQDLELVAMSVNCRIDELRV